MLSRSTGRDNGETRRYGIWVHGNGGTHGDADPGTNTTDVGCVCP